LKYTAAQRVAVETINDPLLIVACAGSGKTQVISQRIVEILRAGAEPRNIVAFTFTERAAAELKDRITSLVEEEFGNVLGLAEMYVGTMHGYALDILHSFVPESFKYDVLNDIQTRLFVDRRSNKCGLSTAQANVHGQLRSLRRWVNSNLYIQVMSIVREEDVDRSLLPETLVEAERMYRHELRLHRYFDFTEVLRRAADALHEEPDSTASGALVRHVRDTLRYVVVDEYQDTNHVQERMINGLTRFGANLCVVGDDDQTIYQWRGSAVSNIQTFEKRHRDVRRVTLDDNFRSSRGITALARSVVESIVPGRLSKEMIAAGHQAFERGDILALSFTAAAAESRWICDRIQLLRGTGFQDVRDGEPRGLSYSDVAVLFRSVSIDAGPLVEEMKRRRIPYVIKGLTRLFDTAEIRACVASFQYVIDGLDADDVVDSWLKAELGLTRAVITRGLAVLDRAKDWSRGERWGTYNIQRTYLDLLEALALREDTIPSQEGRVRGELVFYNLGKFSQAISDFEQINFQSNPEQKYLTFAGWLENTAPNYYADSDEDVGYATPDAVTIATVHQAKGMQWPAVFVPAMRKNRFPSKRHGGLGVFHVVPETAVPDADRYRGTVEDEARLFYVAITRAQKYLAMTFSPGDNRLYAASSPFFDLVTRNPYVLTAEPRSAPPSGPVTPALMKLEPRPLHEVPRVVLTFSEVKYFFDCPYQFKLRFLYGFNAPLHEALGYGKSVHDAMAEIHKRAIDANILTPSAAEELVDRHLHVPFAYPALRADLHRAAVDAVERYLRDNHALLSQTMYSEQQVQVHIAPGITVDGRIDLIRRLDTDEISVVDFKSTERAQAEDVTRDQLHVYALGYEELSGRPADLVEVLNLDKGAKSTREVVDAALLTGIRSRIEDAGNALRTNTLARHADWCHACDTCDLAGLCRERFTRSL
jgi:DNA helicase-2/ATP-dependent DNA helicase PcrA